MLHQCDFVSEGKILSVLCVFAPNHSSNDLPSLGVLNRVGYQLNLSVSNSAY